MTTAVVVSNTRPGRRTALSLAVHRLPHHHVLRFGMRDQHVFSPLNLAYLCRFIYASFLAAGYFLQLLSALLVRRNTLRKTVQRSGWKVAASNTSYFRLDNGERRCKKMVSVYSTFAKLVGCFEQRRLLRVLSIRKASGMVDAGCCCIACWKEDALIMVHHTRVVYYML